jgi:hypothetical protein
LCQENNQPPETGNGKIPEESGVPSPRRLIIFPAAEIGVEENPGSATPGGFALGKARGRFDFFVVQSENTTLKLIRLMLG